MSRVKKYCVTNGTVNRVQQTLFEGGSVPGIADIAYAMQEASGIMHRGNMGEYVSFGYAASYTGFFYDSLYCFGKTMFQNANGREISSSQTLLCAWEDVADGNLFMQEVIRFPFLSLEELLASASYRKHQVFDREERAFATAEFNDIQKVNIARVVYWLLMGKSVVLQLPEVEDYETYSLQVLQEIFQTIPHPDRREISFSTARSINDIVRLKGRIQLILTSESLQKVGEAEWIRLNEPSPFSCEEAIIGQWQKEKQDVRADIEQYYLFMESERKKHRNPKKDYAALEKLYNRESYWWRNYNGEGIIMMTFQDVLSEYRSNPTLAVQSNRKEFFGKVCKLLNKNASNEDTPEKNLISVLIDYIYEKRYESKDGVNRLFENETTLDAFINTCESEYSWFGMDEQWIRSFSDEIRLLKEILTFDSIA